MYLYDTNNDRWENQVSLFNNNSTTQTVRRIPAAANNRFLIYNPCLLNVANHRISNRDAFSAVLGLDGQRVIIYGGRGITDPTDALYVLDINKWEWYVPKISGPLPKVVTYAHRSIVIDKYMFITFGKL